MYNSYSCNFVSHTNACVSRLRGSANNWPIHQNLSNKIALAGRLHAMLDRVETTELATTSLTPNNPKATRRET